MKSIDSPFASASIFSTLHSMTSCNNRYSCTYITPDTQRESKLRGKILVVSRLAIKEHRVLGKELHVL
jgi:hypothetical protein